LAGIIALIVLPVSFIVDPLSGVRDRFRIIQIWFHLDLSCDHVLIHLLLRRAAFAGRAINGAWCGLLLISEYHAPKKTDVQAEIAERTCPVSYRPAARRRFVTAE
jgi:hypothetical protein